MPANCSVVSTSICWLLFLSTSVMVFDIEQYVFTVTVTVVIHSQTSLHLQ